MTTAVDKSPAYARLSAVATAGDLSTAPTPRTGTRPPALSASRDLGPADTVLIVGDYDAERPISEILKPITDRGTKCLWVPGRHDVDNSRWYDNTFEAMPTSNLHGTYRSAGGRIVGGLGGIFGETVWHFRFEMTPATHQSPDAYMRTLRHQERWRKWLPLDKRAFNFPETYEQVARLKLDILVTHEAPAAGHEYGFVAMDELLGAPVRGWCCTVTTTAATASRSET